ncbi:hypothetical protein B0H17DRAFT_188495 [Mycena rosella]|uniref:Uncharacterized protein n=1 Tax=Mycena rosella TaxID=1033263 RepID=A0AAD7DXY4_MYCRO|nr:hypothetical protein B0H17DRAFT_188495 [Mycena rosella]
MFHAWLFTLSSGGFPAPLRGRTNDYWIRLGVLPRLTTLGYNDAFFFVVRLVNEEKWRAKLPPVITVQYPTGEY